VLSFPAASFHEWLTGSYWMLDAPTDELAMGVDLKVTTPDLRALVSHKVWQLSGTIDAERLAKGQSIAGTICLRRLDEGRIPYRFAFRGDDGRPYELNGHKEWHGLSPLESLTLLSAGLYDGRGEEVARATLRFDPRADGLRWLRHIRLQF
jgi:hypothetical protein